MTYISYNLQLLYLILRQHRKSIDILTKELSTAKANITGQLAHLAHLEQERNAQDTQIQDLQRAARSDQTKIEELGVKLHSAKAEYAQLKVKLGEAVTTTQASALFFQDGLNERDRRIAALEKAVIMEKNRRGDAESQLRDTIQAKKTEETRRSRETLIARSRLEQRETEIVQLRAELDRNLITGEKEKERLVAQVGCQRDMLSQAATYCGKLVSESVSQDSYDQLRREHTSLQFHSFELAENLAKSEEQVAEKDSLILQMLEEKDFMVSMLCSAEEEWSPCEASKCEKSHEISQCTHNQLSDHLLTAQRDLQHDNKTTADLCAALEELETTREELDKTSYTLDATKSQVVAITKEVKDLKFQSNEQAKAQERALQKTKDTAKLMTSLQQSINELQTMIAQ